MQTRYILLSVLVGCLALGALALSACSRQAAQGSAPGPAAAIVSIDTGTLQGAVADGVESFKGIPYAAPPVGELRWEPPQPPARWSEVRQATAFGHDCAQQSLPNEAAPLRSTPSEDCLYLNVWRPVGAHGLPVMVWIYGGGFVNGGLVNGGSSPAAYDGTHLAAKGVVLVSFNYRLGRFGFFAFPALTAERPHGLLGNYGYLDQLAALRWVQTNIAAFGGDPHNVTVFSESAGSMRMLLTSPLASGLFQKMIIEFGGARDPPVGDRRLVRALAGLQSGERIGVNFARARGIAGTGAAALAALRALPTGKIVAGAGMMRSSGPRTYAGPLVDGRIVVGSPERAYRSGQFAQVPLLIGAGSAPARFVAAEFAAHGLTAYEYRFSYVAPAAAAALAEIPYVFDTIGAVLGAGVSPADEASARAASTYWTRFAKSGNPSGVSDSLTHDSLPAWPAYSSKTHLLMNFTQAGPMVAAAGAPRGAPRGVPRRRARPADEPASLPPRD